MYMYCILLDTVVELIRRRWPGLDYDLLVPCPGHPPQPCDGRFKLRVLERLLTKHHPTILCEECLEEHAVTSLVTGYSVPREPLEKLLEERVAQLTRIEESVTAVDAKMNRLDGVAADAAHEIRVVRNALATEVNDCPRLLTIEAATESGWDPRRLWRNRYRLHLWCEHPGHEHRCDDPGYEFTQTEEWLQRAAPYIGMTAKILRFLPVASAGADVVATQVTGWSDEAERVARAIDLMNTIGDSMLPKTEITDRTDENLVTGGGASLRAMRELLFELDPARSFAQLRRILTDAGDYLWICPEHYPIYDPGLPVLP